MTDWGKWITIILGAIALIVLGYLIHLVFVPKPSVEVKETIKYDTLYQTKVVTFTETKTDTIVKITDRIFTYSDSIMGTKNEVGYQIKHTIQSDKKVTNIWEVSLEPILKTITQYITKDSIRTIIEPKYISSPFYMNPYFWSSVILTIITALAIIF